MHQESRCSEERCDGVFVEVAFSTASLVCFTGSHALGYQAERQWPSSSCHVLPDLRRHACSVTEEALRAAPLTLLQVSLTEIAVFCNMKFLIQPHNLSKHSNNAFAIGLKELLDIGTIHA